MPSSSCMMTARDCPGAVSFSLSLFFLSLHLRLVVLKENVNLKEVFKRKSKQAILNFHKKLIKLNFIYKLTSTLRLSHSVFVNKKKIFTKCLTKDQHKPVELGDLQQQCDRPPSLPKPWLAQPTPSPFFCFTRRFWNQIFTCFSDNFKLLAISIRRSRVKYWLTENSRSKSSSCLLVKAVRMRLLESE